MPTVVTEEKNTNAEVPTDADEAAAVEIEKPKEESFKALIREFVMGDAQDPGNAPGLRFYVVFAAMIAAALLFVVVVAVIMGIINLFRG